MFFFSLFQPNIELDSLGLNQEQEQTQSQQQAQQPQSAPMQQQTQAQGGFQTPTQFTSQFINAWDDLAR